MTIISPTRAALPPEEPEFVAEQARQRREAADRMRKRDAVRAEHEAVLREPGGLARADDPTRIAKRLDRVTRYLVEGEATVASPHADRAELVADALDLAAQLPGETPSDSGVLLEKIINTADFLGVRYLDDGVAAARAIGRVHIKAGSGALAGYGTGFLVSPHLLLTNHHVLPDAATAGASTVEFDYQDGPGGIPMVPREFGFAPDLLFVADRERDFALVAVTGPPEELAQYGFHRLTDQQGTVIIGEAVTIVQHPRGEKKQIALRENKVVDIPERFVHYSADTEPGSSGSPVFNDQWEVVALHHASVPAPQHTEFGGFLNEGVRISRILQLLREQSFSPEAAQLLTDVLGPPAQHEAITIDPDYSNRAGYAANFLGVNLPMPEPVGTLAGALSAELRYHHFSIRMHRQRRLALITAVNIDGTQHERPPRENDRWILDPRLPADEQVGEQLYADNDLDRGHLVRRLDPAWGPAFKAANDDTFHFTNCTPQHHDFNAGSTLWLGLEDYVLRNAENHRLAVTVFTGPVLAADDPIYRDVALPRQYWKMISMVKPDGRLSVTAYLLSQAELLDEFRTGREEFVFGQYRTFQVPVRRIGDLTGLVVTRYVAADPLEALESFALPREILRPQDLVL
ncbi:MAG TPA: DNA/RNA non-specific endonuclease [Aldersonia sp.]